LSAEGRAGEPAERGNEKHEKKSNQDSGPDHPNFHPAPIPLAFVVSSRRPFVVADTRNALTLREAPRIRRSIHPGEELDFPSWNDELRNPYWSV